VPLVHPHELFVDDPAEALSRDGKQPKQSCTVAIEVMPSDTAALAVLSKCAASQVDEAEAHSILCFAQHAIQGAVMWP
jgi:hypothetical protein